MHLHHYRAARSDQSGTPQSLNLYSRQVRSLCSISEYEFPYLQDTLFFFIESMNFPRVEGKYSPAA